MTILDSGERKTFDTGAVRDIQEGKGRCDLLPLDILSKRFEGDEYMLIDRLKRFMEDRDVTHLYIVLNLYRCLSKQDEYTAWLELAKHFEEGAKKYDENNWKKGIPVKNYIDSAVRHFLKWRRGDSDENHSIAFMWNIVCCIWTAEDTDWGD